MPTLYHSGAATHVPVLTDSDTYFADSQPILHAQMIPKQTDTTALKLRKKKLSSFRDLFHTKRDVLITNVQLPNGILQIV